MTNPQPTSVPTSADKLEEERAQERRGEALIAAIPNIPAAPTLPSHSASFMSESPDVVAAHLIGAFEQHLKLVVGNVEQLSDMWIRAWQEVRGSLELMENTARIMQVVIGEASDTQQNLSDAVNRLGVATTAIAQTNLQLQAFLQAQQARQ
jgi:hypothetical protein